jgi:eukaryotic-like serine/threonine-protein kinase
MNFLPDHIIRHLRREIDRPDFSGTHYELEEEIGRGGMGTVFRARDTVLGRDVAVKVVDADETPLAESEGGMLARLEHPGIVPVYEAGELADGRRYYAMRLVRGVRLDEFAGNEESLAARLRIFLKVCETVAFAHRREIVHGDLKPQNIMVGELGQVFVLDWGIARHAGSGRLPGGGTPRYMAPDSADGGGEQSDVFSLGRVLEDMLRDQRPAPVVAIAARASAPDASGRYANVEDLAADVTRFLDRLPVVAYRESPLERLARWAGRNQVLLLLLLAYFVVRIVLFWFRL